MLGSSYFGKTAIAQYTIPNEHWNYAWIALNCNEESFASQKKLKGNCYNVVIEFFLTVNRKTNDDF